MWKQIDSASKRNQIKEREYAPQAGKLSLMDSKVAVFMFLWALIVTVLLFYQIGLPIDVTSIIENNERSVNLNSIQGEIIYQLSFCLSKR
jgi:hypothetical protein